jgi:regulatory protein YycI of two-component signal transduction system YycFG
MDWGKAKNIFIISFFVLNVILGYQLWIDRDQKVETVQLTKNREEELKQMLKLKAIDYPDTIPKEVPDLNFLYVKYVKVDPSDPSTKNRETKRMEFNPPLEVSDFSQIENIAEALKSHLSLKDYEVDWFLSQKHRIVFHQLEQGVPLFPSSLEVVMVNGTIPYIEQRQLKVLSQGSARQVISAFTALRTLAEGYLPNQSKIVDIRIGYHGQKFNSDVQVLAPVWRVVLADGGIYYVNAITGGVDIPETPGINIKNEDSDSD